MTILFAIAVAAAGQPATTKQDVHALLRSDGQFSDNDLGAVERDQAAARVLRSTERRELAAVGAVRVRASRASLLDHIRDIVSFKRNPIVLQIGRFSDPPRLDDLARLTLDRDEVDALRRCRPGDCALRLPSNEMERIRARVDWRSSGAGAAATNAMREFLVRRVETYLHGGAPALGEYADKKPPVGVAEEFDRLLAVPLLLRRAPGLLRYLQHFPSERPAGSEHFVYWSKERFGFKPVISVTHVTIYEPPTPDLIAAYVTSKQIYASHYFDAALAVTAVIDTPSPRDRPEIYMIYMTRNRTPMLEGFFANFARGTVRTRTHDGLIETLRTTKERLERDFVRK